MTTVIRIPSTNILWWLPCYSLLPQRNRVYGLHMSTNPQSISPPTQSASLAPLRVLLVDDHELILTVVGRIIKREFPRLELVGTARDRGEALSQARLLRPDVIVLDLDLAGTSGLELMPEFARFTSAQIIIFSASDNVADQQNALAAGARDYVSKLTPADVLLNAISACRHNGTT